MMMQEDRMNEKLPAAFRKMQESGRLTYLYMVDGYTIRRWITEQSTIRWHAYVEVERDGKAVWRHDSSRSFAFGKVEAWARTRDWTLDAIDWIKAQA
jgi:hypothetical protein